MSKHQDLQSDFTAVGQLLDFVIKDGYKIKYLRINISEQEYWIKLPKAMRSTLEPAIKPGSWLEVSGTRKLERKTGKLKLAAEQVQLVKAPRLEATNVVVPQPEIKSVAKHAKVLICQKSSCLKRGGVAVCRAFQDSLRARGLEDLVKLKGTGCLKECKKGPAVVMMPDKVRYTKVTPGQVPGLVTKHFPV